jgi:hypothetical protein
VTIPILSELRPARAVQPPTQRWQHLPIAPRGATRLGISFRSPQIDALGLEPQQTLAKLLEYPFELIRLGAYWSRLEPAPGQFVPDELDRQLDAAEAAGKQIVLSVGAIKTFGYPEYFVPRHVQPQPLPEGRLVQPAEHAGLLRQAVEFVVRIVERYRDRAAIVAWQVEHESVDPLGLEHSWRLSTEFVAAEVQVVRHADPNRPILLNGFLAASAPGAMQQRWRTRDQGDSLAFALGQADIVGVDYYPCLGLASLGPYTLYLDGARGSVPRRAFTQLMARAHFGGRRVIVSEGQAEPWETQTNPPNPPRGAMYSCPPDRLIANYNDCLGWATAAGAPSLEAYLFWGAEYWVLRDAFGDSSYLRAFARVIDQSACLGGSPA